MRLGHAFFAAGLGIAVMPGAAHAQLVSLSSLHMQSNAYTATYDSMPAGSVEAYATAQEFAVSTADTALGLPSELNLFCVEAGQYAVTSANFSVISIEDADEGRASNSIEAYSGISSGGIGSLSGSTLGGTALKLEQLYGYVFGSSYIAASPLDIDLSPAGIHNSAAYDSAVFQMAVWQVTETGTFNNIADSGSIGSGFFVASASAGLVTDADTLLEAVDDDPEVALIHLDVLHNASSQDYILPDPMGRFVQVPEPAISALVLALASVALALIVRCANGSSRGRFV
jgi:hypothetical protein